MMAQAHELQPQKCTGCLPGTAGGAAWQGFQKKGSAVCMQESIGCMGAVDGVQVDGVQAW